MEAVLGGEVVPPGRPGWWETGWALVLGALLALGATLVVVLPLSEVAGVSPVTDGPDHGWPFVPVGVAAVAADLGFAAFVLAMLTVVSRWVLTWWLDRDVAPTWVALGLGLGGFGPLYAGPVASGGFIGLLVAWLVVRFGAFDAGGGARPGVLGALPGRWRRRARLAIAAVPLAGLLVACGYGVTHPLVAPSWGGTGPQVVRTSERPVRSWEMALEPRGLGQVTVLALRPAGAGAGATSVLAAGDPASGDASAPPSLPASATFGMEVWLSAPRCPAPAVAVDRFDARVRSWSGTHWVPLRLSPGIRLRCVR